MSLDPGRTESLSIWADIWIGNLGAWNIDVGYDGSVVTPSDCSAVPYSCEIHLDQETINFSGTASPGVIVVRALGSVNFTATGTPGSQSTIQIQVNQATDDNSQPLDFEVYNGLISVSPTATPTPSPEVPTPTPFPPYGYGDVNCDRAVNSTDAWSLLMFLIDVPQSIDCSPYEPKRDLICEGTINAYDLIPLLRILGGLSAFGYCGK